MKEIVMRKCADLVLAIALLILVGCGNGEERLVILHTNDVHSMIDPDVDNQGGVLRRKVIIDSIRNSEKNVILIDAGDAVQGTPYFSLFGGELEFALLDSLKYDVVILGNHEFDNGLDSIAYFYKKLKATKLSTNYKFDATPYESLWKSVEIKPVGNKKVAFLGVNLDPKGMIADANCVGVEYINPIGYIDSIAGSLKSSGVADAVVAVTHIGYKTRPDLADDVTLIKQSRNIDLLIGGHSHTIIDSEAPGDTLSQIKNLDGKMITVCQAGGSGKRLGYVELVFSQNGELNVSSRLIPVTEKYDDRIDTRLEEYISAYKHVVDSLMTETIVVSEQAMVNRVDNSAVNWIADMAMEIIPEVYSGKVDFAIMNKGGMRKEMPEGNVSVGLINAMFPFDNKLWVIEITGADLLEAFKVMAGRGGDSVSKGVYVEYNESFEITKATLNGKAIISGKKYKVATLDYLANGGDYMAALKNGTPIAKDTEKFGDVVLQYLKNLGKQGIKVKSTGEKRMCKK